VLTSQTSFAPSTKPISVDLLPAWERSENKPEGWTHENAGRALHRYERFLHLVAAVSVSMAHLQGRAIPGFRFRDFDSVPGIVPGY
jgi:hypothetical protein